jgi:hypothetical protein
MKKSIILFVIVLFQLLFFSPLYSAYYDNYYPSNVKAPLFNKQNELHFGATLVPYGYSFPFAYSINDWLGIIAQGSYFSSESEVQKADLRTVQTSTPGYTYYIKEIEKFSYLFTGYNIEIAPGYYNPLSDLFTFEVFSGLGFGNSKNELIENGKSKDITTNQTFNTSYLKFFLLSDIGLKHDIVDVGIALRMTYAQFFGEIIKDKINSPELYGEGLFFLRLGYKWVKVGFQLGYLQPLVDSDKIKALNYIVSLGLHFKFEL